MKATAPFGAVANEMPVARITVVGALPRLRDHRAASDEAKNGRNWKSR
jgi:hypothetical protein